MSLLEDYEEVLSQYKEMIRIISQIEEESVTLAYELQKEMFRVSEIYAQNEDLRKIFHCIQQTEEITNDNSAESFDLTTVPVNKSHLLSESLYSATLLLDQVKNEFQNLNLTDQEETK